VTRCRIFICRLCRRIIAGCTQHRAEVEEIDSCAVCTHKEKK
jgi:hypothetical protein